MEKCGSSWLATDNNITGRRKDAITCRMTKARIHINTYWFATVKVVTRTRLHYYIMRTFLVFSLCIVSLFFSFLLTFCFLFYAYMFVSFLLLLLLLLLLFVRDRAYAPDAPQPVGLLCYPSVLDVPTFAASPSPRPCYPRDP
jgi:hypothetical protein